MLFVDLFVTIDFTLHYGLVRYDLSVQRNGNYILPGQLSSLYMSCDVTCPLQISWLCVVYLIPWHSH